MWRVGDAFDAVRPRAWERTRRGAGAGHGTGLGCNGRALNLTELSDAGELFLTNGIVGVQPVSQVDGERLWRTSASGGLLTRELAEAYALAVTAECGEG